MGNNRKRSPAVILLLALAAAVGFLLLFFLDAILMMMIFPQGDGYLITGFTFYTCSAVTMMMLLPAIFAIRAVKEGWEAVKEWIKSNRDTMLKVASLLVFFAVILFVCAARYVKDLKSGPRQAVMTNAEVKRERHQKGGYETYLIGDIGGESVRLIITREAGEEVEDGDCFIAVEIQYYEHIGEVFEIDTF